MRQLCAIADELFRKTPALQARFPKCPAIQGNSSSLIKFVTDRPGHDRRYAIDCRKLENELSFSPAVPLAEGLTKTFDWYLKNESWWRSVMNGSYRQWISEKYGEANAG